MGFVENHDELKKSLNGTIIEFLGQVSMIEEVSEKLMKLDDYIWRLEDEMKKIVTFKNELPISMLILGDAIVAVREEAMRCRKLSTGPVLEQFIPLKEKCEEIDGEKVAILKESRNSKEKMSWLSSVQLWNSNPNNNKQGAESDIRKKIDDDLSTMKSCESQSMGVVFGTVKGYNGFPLEVTRKDEDLPLVPELSLRIPGIKSSRDDILTSGLGFKPRASSRTGSSSTSNGQSSVPIGSQSQHHSNRKERRCWSVELHRQFIAALEQLGGAQVATPKQIRDVMQVDCLTNDEVKSHLQKYRLHIRKDPATKSSAQDHSLARRGLWSSQEKVGEAPKQSNSQSGSPHSPFHFDGNLRGTSMSAGHSVEDEGDEKSESGSWKNHHVHLSEN